jgi:hypothetical protein
MERAGIHNGATEFGATKKCKSPDLKRLGKRSYMQACLLS